MRGLFAALLVALLAAVPALAGCSSPGGGPSPTTDTSACTQRENVVEGDVRRSYVRCEDQSGDRGFISFFQRCSGPVEIAGQSDFTAGRIEYVAYPSGGDPETDAAAEGEHTPPGGDFEGTLAAGTPYTFHVDLVGGFQGSIEFTLRCTA